MTLRASISRLECSVIISEAKNYSGYVCISMHIKLAVAARSLQSLLWIVQDSAKNKNIRVDIFQSCQARASTTEQIK